MSARRVRGRWRTRGRTFEGVASLDAGRIVVDVHDAEPVTADSRSGDGVREETWTAERARDGTLFLRSPDGTRVRARVLRRGDRAWVAVDGVVHEVERLHGAQAPGAAAEEDIGRSPMTGLLTKVSVETGARVPAGGELFVVEAMKMEYVIRAPRDLRVAEVRQEAGARVELGQVVMIVDPSTLESSARDPLAP